MASDDPHHHDPPHLFECMLCGHKLRSGESSVSCPNCDAEMKNVSKPSANPGLSGPSY